MSGWPWPTIAGRRRSPRARTKGRRLHHVAILRSLRKIGAVKRGAAFAQNVAVPPGAGRVIVFVQDSGLGKVYGVGML